MGRILSRRSGALVLSITVSACAADAPSTREAPAPSDQAIFGGALDTSHTAVQALIRESGNGVSACSGTTIAVDGTSGFLLTAAHCVVEVNPATGAPYQPVRPVAPEELMVVPGNDWLTSAMAGTLFRVAAATRHPAYDGDATSPYDIAVVRYTGAGADTPKVPILTSADDKLAVGTTLTAVGYGVTERNEQNTRRYSVGFPISRLSSHQILNDQTNGKGACSGDSGGPDFVTSSGVERVAAITSSGDEACLEVGVSVRVSAHEGFITNVVQGVPVEADCDTCAAGSGAAGNVCRAVTLACGSGSPCGDYADCLTACTTPACETACKTTNPSGAAAYESFASCVCEDACPTECSTSPGCKGLACGGFEAADPQCNQCIHGTCCIETEACSGNSTCKSCIDDPTPTSCAANVPFQKVADCLSSCSGNPCNIMISGAGGSGGSNGGIGGHGGTQNAGNAGNGAAAGKGGTAGSGGRAPQGGGAVATGGRTDAGGIGGMSGDAPIPSGGAPTPSGGASSAPSSGKGGTGPHDTPNAGRAGGTDSEEPKESSCSCALPGSARSNGALSWIAAASIGLTIARRRRAR